MMLLYEDPLNEYVDRLLWWNAKVNLVSRELKREDVLLHVKHSLTPARHILDSHIPMWLDCGTGGGLPGIPLALICRDVLFVLNDVVEKKGVVLKDIIATLGLRNASVNIRDVAKFETSAYFGVVSKHAFKMSDLLERLNGKSWSELLMLKGSDYESEIADLKRASVRVAATSLAEATPSSFFEGKYLIRICPTQSTAAHVV